MKKTHLILTSLVLVMLLFSSCKKDKPGDLGDNTVTTAAGRYGGVMVGSSGYFIVNLVVGSKGTATVYFDGSVYHLTTVMQIEAGSSYHDLRFSTADEQVLMYFTVAEDGSNPTVRFEIPGHTVVATVDQYGSDNSSLSLYQGSSYSSSGSSYIIYTFNMALNHSDNTFEAISMVRATNTSTPEGQTEVINGTFSLSGNSITLSYDGQTLNGIIVDKTIQFDQPDFTMTGSEAAAGGEIMPPAGIAGKWIPYLFFNGSAYGSSIEMVNVNECPQGKYVEMYAEGTYKDVWWAVVNGQCEDVNNSSVLNAYTINGNKITLGGAPFSILELSEDKFIFEGYSEDNGQHYYFKGEYHREK